MSVEWLCIDSNAGVLKKKKFLIVVSMKLNAACVRGTCFFHVYVPWLLDGVCTDPR